MNYLSVVKILLSIITFSSFSWAASKFFLVKDQGAKKGKKIITALGLPSMILSVYFLVLAEDISNSQNIFSSLLYIFSLIIFWLSISASKKNQLSFAFSEEKPTGIVVRGPYSLVRHPFYLSYTIAWAAGFVGSNNLILLLILFIMFALYLSSAKNEERVLLSSSLSHDYLNYKKIPELFFQRFLMMDNFKKNH